VTYGFLMEEETPGHQLFGWLWFRRIWEGFVWQWAYGHCNKISKNISDFRNYEFFEILSFEILSFEILSFEILSFEILSFEILSFRDLEFRDFEFRDFEFRNFEFRDF
jgi:hypothetical protein